MSVSPSEPNDSSDSASESSTIVYELESFVDFRPKFLTLARTKIWPRCELDDEIIIDRLKGGGFNRIIGLTLVRSRSGRDCDPTDSTLTRGRDSKDVPIEYILRIPRSDSAQVNADVAALLFVQRLAQSEQQESKSPEIPTPQVIMFDLTKDNAIESPYMVQNRLRGRPLIDVFPHLTHEQQRRVAQELGMAYHRMLAVSGSQAGKLVLPKSFKSLDAEVHVTVWDAGAEIFGPLDAPRKCATTTPYRAGRDGESVLTLLTRTFQTQKAEIQEFLPKDTLRPTRLDQFCTMASELDAKGYFTDFNGYSSLTHLDLEPRNILVDTESSPTGRIISSILDWDSAVLAPAFMSCTPPMWLWSWKDDEDEDERLANEIPATVEQRELKEVFESAAGASYVAAAYQPAYRLARRLVHFAIHGIRSTEDDDEAADMLAEWQELSH